MFQFSKITDLISRMFSKPKFTIQTLASDFREPYTEDERQFINVLLVSGRFLHNEKDEVIYDGQLHFCADDTMLEGAITSLKEKAKCNISADTVQNLLAEVVGTLYDNGVKKLQVVLYYKGTTQVYNLPDLHRVINVINGFCLLHTAKGKIPTPAFYERAKGIKVFMTWQPPQHNFAKGDIFGFHTLELDTPPTKHGAVPVFFTYEAAKKHLAEMKDPRFQVAMVDLVGLVRFVKGQFSVVLEPFTNYWLELNWPDQSH